MLQTREVLLTSLSFEYFHLRKHWIGVFIINGQIYLRAAPIEIVFTPRIRICFWAVLAEKVAAAAS